jgi:hypothetical protein
VNAQKVFDPIVRRLIDVYGRQKTAHICLYIGEKAASLSYWLDKVFEPIDNFFLMKSGKNWRLWYKAHDWLVDYPTGRAFIGAVRFHFLCYSEDLDDEQQIWKPVAPDVTVAEVKL